MDKKYDVIVVGAGNGGLAAAAYAAHEGLKVLLLEKHNLPGGCATSFVRGRFEFEPSLHELCSVGTAENPDTVYKLFDDLGAKIDWRYEYNPFRVILKGKNGYDYTMKGGNRENFIESMEKAVPGCGKSLRKFFKLKEKCDAALDYIVSMKGKPNGLVMITKHADFMKTAAYSVEEVMTACGVPKKAQQIITTYWGYLGVPTDEICAMHFLNMLLGYLDDGAAMPTMRSHEMSSALCKVIYDNGGEIYFNTEVTEFLYNEDGSMKGVVAGGNTYYADEIISNIIANNVINRSDITKVPERTIRLANARKFGISVATVYLGLDCSVEELGLKDYTSFVTTTPDAREQYEKRKNGTLYILNSLNIAVPESSPKGTCTLFFTMPIFGSDIPEDLTPQTYKKYKNEIARKYIKDAEETFGIDITSHIEEISVATPVTFARYLGTPEGTIYGYYTAGWDNIIIRVSEEKKDYSTPGITYCGGHATRGDGYSCALITGMNAGKAVAKRANAKKEGGNI